MAELIPSKAIYRLGAILIRISDILLIWEIKFLKFTQNHNITQQAKAILYKENKASTTIPDFETNDTEVIVKTA